MVLTPLRLEKTGPQRWRLLEPLVWVDRGLRVEAGFETDLASIPLWLGSLLPKVGWYDAAAVFHDAAYEGRLIGPGGPVVLSKQEADGMFYTLLRESGVGRLRSWLMYRAVRRWGRGPRFDGARGASDVSVANRNQ